MSSCLAIVNHTFRLNSRLFREVLKNNNKVTVVYVSPWYSNEKEKEIISSGDQTFYKRSINYFAKELSEKLSIPLYLLKARDPSKSINDIVKKHGFDRIYYDMPLFGKSSWLKLTENFHIIDSDSYDPKCEKMTAKSRWVYWSKHRSKNIANDPKIKICNYKNINLPTFIINEEEYTDLKLEINRVMSRLNDIIPSYYETRNHKEGSTRLSKYLHHGVIDSAEITSCLFDILPDFFDNNHPIVPLLRQLAFREICIRKSRIKDLSLETSVDDWAHTLLDKKSYENLIKEFPGSFTKEQFLSGRTGTALLDAEIKRLKAENWLPNRIRMWISSQCYYGIGGGIDSLKTLIKLFNDYSDDGQSPNNYVCCVEAMRLQYGKVMNYNTQRTFKLVDKF